MGLVALLSPVCFICLLVIILNLFTNTTNNNHKFGWKQRLWIIINLLVWAYEFFFMVVVCEGVENLRVDFGGGLGDLFYIFILAGVVLLHIVLLAIFTYNHLQTFFFVVLMCMPVFPLMLMHLNAAQGNEENDYMISGNWAGLYYNRQAQYEQRMHEREAEEAKKTKKPEFATEFESYLYDAEHGDLWAQNHIGRCYALGDGIEQNDKEAFRWLRLAARQEHEWAQKILRENKQTW